MAVSGKYGKLNIPNIAENEPVFILRAQDKLAAAAVQMYLILAESHAAGVVEGIQKEVEGFRGWQGKKKLPDLFNGFSVDQFRSREILHGDSE
jgi:hypothetical protein